jgi:cytosine/adenosine deaminase-related metal-dependent hydrolase
MNQLDTERMVKEIANLVESDFCFDIDARFASDEPKFTQEEAKQMAWLLGRVYSIAHCIHCTACQRKYLLDSKK